MIGLRSEDQVDRLAPPGDFLAFGLRNAAGDADGEVAAALAAQLGETSKL